MKHDGPRAAQEIELEVTDQTSNKNGSRRRKRGNTAILAKDVKLSFVTHVGWDGMLVLFFMLCLSGFALYLVYEYTGWFANFERENLFVFMILSIMYLIATVYLVLRWKHIALDYTQRATGGKNPHSNMSEKLSAKLKRFYRETCINGSYYLWKLYLIELLESFNQLNNLLQVYLCSMPVEFSSCTCLILSIDSCFRAYEISLDNSASRRDRQIKVDAVMDAISMVAPLAIIWFGYNVSITLNEMIFIIVLPAVCLFSKLRSIFREILHLRSYGAVERARAQVATQMKRRRNSLYAMSETIKIAKRQQEMIPPIVRKGFVAYNYAYAVFMLTVGLAQYIIFLGNKCASTSIPLWEKQCVVKTPFCGRLFQPTCNCAVLNVQRHNWSSLPKGILDMSALKKMRINHGGLRDLNEDVDKRFAKLVFLDLSFNRLRTIPTSLGNLGLNVIKLANNQLSSIPDSVWSLEQLFHLELDNNNISHISSTIANAKSLTVFLSSNNTLVEVPDELFNLNVASLYLDGNNLTSMPEHIGKLKTLTNLRLSNNYISRVVVSMRNLMNLHDIDLRNNRIVTMPEDAIDGLNNLKYIYLYPNPICSNGWLDTAPTVKEIVEQSNDRGAGCRAQCSLYCQDRILKRKSKMCARDCNSESCSYDGGRCLK